MRNREWECANVRSSYPRGLVIMIALVAAGFVLVVVQMGIYRFTGRKRGGPVEQECWE